MNPVQILVGVVLLFAGRRLFWLFVALAGFLLGVRLADRFVVDASELIRFAVAIGTGIVGALLAIAFQRAAFAVAGFIGGCYLGIVIAQHGGVGEQVMVVAVLAGIAGAIITSLIADTAIILLSALIGAAALVSAVELERPIISLIGWLILAAIGVGVQRRQQVISSLPRDRR